MTIIAWDFMSDTNGARVVDKLNDATIASCPNAVHAYAEDMVRIYGIDTATLIVKATNILESLVDVDSPAGIAWKEAKDAAQT